MFHLLVGGYQLTVRDDRNQIVVATKGVILHKGKILVVQRAPEDVGGGTWECPGGKLDFGEDIEEGLIREISEEVGLNVSVEKLLFANSFKTNPARQIVMLSYLCSTDNDNVILSNEHMDYKWATKNELLSILPSTIIRDFKKYNIFSLQELI